MRDAPLLIAGLLAFGAVPSAATNLASDPQTRSANLERLVHQDCGSCHGMTLRGGLGPDLTPTRMAKVAAETIAAIILDGVPGTAMPPWRPLMSEQDALWIANYLRNGAQK